MDLDFETKFEECYQVMMEGIGKISPSGMRSGRILAYCTCVFAFFNGLFGEGTDKKMFGDKTNMRECDTAIEALSLCISESLAEYDKSGKESADKIAGAFGVKQNRAQKRVKK